MMRKRVVENTDEKWLLKFKPNEDELLSSWLIRLINGHGALIHTFCRQLWPGLTIWTKDIDLNPDDAIIRRLAEKTGYDNKIITDSSLKGYQNKFYDNLIQGTNHWILSLGLYHRVRNRKAQQFCPQCLTEDKTPYFRKRWRLGCYTICSKHKKHLLDSCPVCSSVITPNKLLWDQFGTPYCNTCNQNMCDIKLESKPPSQSVQDFHEGLEQIRKHGYINYQGQNISGTNFMYGLKIFITALTRSNYDRKLLKLGVSVADLECLDFEELCSKLRQFEYLDLSVRSVLIEALSALLFMPNHQFVKIMRSSRIGSSCFFGTEFKNFPKWFDLLMDQINLNNQL